MNKKGFTIMEVLCVIIIMTILLAIAFPIVLTSYNRQKINQWDNQVVLIENAAKNYVREYRDLLPEIEYEDSSTFIELNDLVEAGLLTWPITDTRDNAKVDIYSKVKVTLTSDREYIYEYQDDKQF